MTAGELAGRVFKGLVNGVLCNYFRQRDALLAAGNQQPPMTLRVNRCRMTQADYRALGS